MAAWDQVCLKAGFKPHEETVRLTEGSKAWQICLEMAKYRGVKITKVEAIDMAETKNVLFRTSNKTKIYKEIPDIISLAKKLKLKLAVVTGTSEKNLKTVLEDKILNNFDFVVVDENSPKGKPFPDPYLTAAKNMNVSPQDCIVIENAPLGIQSAKAAGMFCIALQTTLPREHLSQADVTYYDHSELLENITHLIKD
jgi:beta-phosphoglucomutase